MPGPIAPCLWFNGVAEEAVNFYCSIFPNSGITAVDHYMKDSPGPEGEVMFIEFTLNSQQFQAINAGDEFAFTHAISLSIDCADQQEVDYYWDRLLEGGEPVQCGWLTDRYGLSWQVVPRQLNELLRSSHPERANNVMKAMLQMVKLDVAELQRAFDADAVAAG